MSQTDFIFCLFCVAIIAALALGMFLGAQIAVNVLGH